MRTPSSQNRAESCKKYFATAAAVWLLLNASMPVRGAVEDVVLYTSDLAAVGQMSKISDGSAASGQFISSPDAGWSSTESALASPSNYVEGTFAAEMNVSYRVWVRLRSTGNSKWNDSVWVQFSDATDTGGNAAYRIGTSSGLAFNLETCKDCGMASWGWPDGAYWLSQPKTIRFPSGGTHTVRVQAREDGVQFDQIVLSPVNFLSRSPGSTTNDSTIVSKGAGGGGSGLSPFRGSPAPIPGIIQAEDFDNGGSGVAYGDATSGNNGGAYRSTNVDIEPASSGGFDVGWIAGGEWMNYTVNVTSSGSYTVNLRVASPGGGALHVGFNGSSPVWRSVSVPATGGWQNWRFVSLPVTLAAGSQQLTLVFDTNGFNVDSIEVTAGSSPPPPPPPPPPPSGGTNVPIVTWNVHIDSSAAHARGVVQRVLGLSPRPQIVIFQEALQSLASTYLDEFQVRTGQTWQGAFKTHCPPGAWNGSSCSGSEDEGVAVFTSFPIMNSSGIHLAGSVDQWHSARAAVRAAVSINGIVTQVFSVHLPVVTSSRYAAMPHFKSWASGYSTPQLVGGDFNADPNQIDINEGMGGAFIDSWSIVGVNAGYTAFTPSPTMKLDYLFGDNSGKVSPISSTVVTSMGTFSDHFPVTGLFTVRP